MYAFASSHISIYVWATVCICVYLKIYMANTKSSSSADGRVLTHARIHCDKTSITDINPLNMPHKSPCDLSAIVK